MNQTNKEKRINVSSAVYFILKHSLLSITIIIAFTALLAFYGYRSEKKAFNSSVEASSSQEKKFTGEALSENSRANVDAYVAKFEKYCEAIDSITAMYVNGLDSSNVYTGCITYSIRNESGNISGIINNLNLIIYNGEALDRYSDVIGQSLSKDDVTRILVSENTGDLYKLTMYVGDSEVCDEMLQCVADIINENRAEIKSNYGDFEITLKESYSFSGYSAKIQTIQTEYNKSITSLKDELTSDLKKMTTAEIACAKYLTINEKTYTNDDPEVEIDPISKKSIVKFAAIGLVLGILIVFGWAFWVLLFSSRIQTELELPNNYGIDNIGAICTKIQYSGELFGTIKRISYEKEHHIKLSNYAKEEDCFLEYLSAYAKMKINGENKAIGLSIDSLDNISEEVIVKICKSFERSGINTVWIDYQGESICDVRAFEKIDDVLIVTILGKSRRQVLTQMTEQAARMDKRILGAVVIC